VNIRLDATYVLTNDETGLILMRDEGKVDGKGRPIRESAGFYGHLSDAVDGYIRRRVLKSEATTLDALLAELKGIRAEVKELLKGVEG